MINILITLQLVLCIYYIYSFISIISFKDDYIKLYEKSYPVENGFLVNFAPAQLNNGAVDIEKVLGTLDNNNISYGIMLSNSDEKYKVPVEELNISSRDLISKCEYAPMQPPSVINPWKVNFEALKYNENKIKGNINKEIWNRNNDDIPIVIGKNFDKKLNIGERFYYNKQNYIIVGMFDDEILYSSYYDTVFDAIEISGSFMIPTSPEDFKINNELATYNYEPITIYGYNDGTTIKIEELKQILKGYISLIEISDYKKDLNWFMDEIHFEILRKIIKTSIITILTIASLIISMTFKLLMNKEKIGVMYSIGLSKKDIFKTYLKEFILFIIISIILSFIVVSKFGRFSFRYFMIYNKLFYWCVALTILILLVIICLIVVFNKLNKMTPKDMMGGFIE
ncbi:ABC-type antimicrobial peptide transport system permease subunit [Eubacterium multiforme]|uniref:ABC-type antimicrobial peptide transport system permease subunit n=2 Tax=Eubacterium multiforme TaxID=83339 RepID=A0ABT9UN96_9FIRM|nr:ABC-type antimicrobial peptide transport system permease subunit [Eubacterium multiforme]